MQRFPAPQGGNRPCPVMEYVRQFDHLSRYALDMVHMETKKNVSLGTDEGWRKCYDQVHFRIWEVNEVVKGLGSR